MKSWAELNQRRELEQCKINLRRSESGVRIIIGGGTVGVAAGARSLTKVTLDEILQNHLEGEAVVQLAEMDVEGQAPLVKIEQDGQPAVVYGNVTPEKLHEIFSKHVVGGEVVEEWVVAS